MDELKPCCGEVPQIRYLAGGFSNPCPCYEIKCSTCHSGVHVDILDLNIKGRDRAKKHAIDLWNRRFSDGTAK